MLKYGVHRTPYYLISRSDFKVKILIRKGTVLTDACYDFPQFLQTDSGVVPHIRTRPFVLHPFRLFISHRGINEHFSQSTQQYIEEL